MKLRYFGAPGRSRTHNLLIRSQTLYPIELRALEMLGAAEKSRTSTGFLPLGPQPSASAIPPRPLDVLTTFISISRQIKKSSIKMMSHVGFEPTTL